MCRKDGAMVPYRYKHFFQKTLFSIFCLCMFISLTLFSSTRIYADTTPGGDVTNPALRAVNIAKPAVVRILTTIPGHLKVHFPPTTDITFPQQDNGSYSLLLSGTGTFITAQGDILTADHVVKPPKDKDLDQALYQQAAPDVAAYMNKQGGTTVTKEDVLQQLTGGQLQSETGYDAPASQVYLSTDYTGALSGNDLNAVPSTAVAKVDTIKKESAPDQQDLAIVHIPMQDTPSVQLGDSTNVQQQQNLTLIGFPGAADVNLKPNDFLTSSVNNIYVSSKKTSQSGAPLIQVGGTVGHGDSGGPAIDSQGTIVGIVSFGTAGADSTGGTSFLQASNSARDLISSINLDTTPGQFQKLWSQAFTDYGSTTPGHWTKAQQGFEQLAKSYPQFQAVQQYLTYARTQAQQELQATATPSATAQVSPTPSPSRNGQSKSTPAASSIPALALTIGAIVLLILLAALLFGVSVRSRHKSKQQAVPKADANVPISNGSASTRGEKALVDSAGKAPAQAASPSTLPAPVAPVTPLPATPAPVSSANTLTLKVWPCGHMNRPNARFCNVCGEPAPTPPGPPQTNV